MRVKEGKSKSKRQQRFMGMVHAVQKGEMKAPSKEVAEVAGSIDKEDAEDFAETKHKGLPEKVKEKVAASALRRFLKTSSSTTSPAWNHILGGDDAIQFTHSHFHDSELSEELDAKRLRALDKSAGAFKSYQDLIRTIGDKLGNKITPLVPRSRGEIDRDLLTKIPIGERLRILKGGSAEAFRTAFFERCYEKGVSEERIPSVVKQACCISKEAASAFSGFVGPAGVTRKEDTSSGLERAFHIPRHRSVSLLKRAILSGGGAGWPGAWKNRAPNHSVTRKKAPDLHLKGMGMKNPAQFRKDVAGTIGGNVIQNAKVMAPKPPGISPPAAMPA